MLFMLDNFDSFTYNLVQYLRALGAEVEVGRNNAVSVADVLARKPEGIVLSPGPGRPENAGILCDLVRAAAGKIPLLGVCLGHQAIAEVFGAHIVPAREVRHGKTFEVLHDGKGLFRKIASPLTAVRYHSLAVARADLPACLEVAAQTADGEIMALRHRSLFIESVQYHPESVMTPTGKRQLANFLEGIRHGRV